MLSSFLSLYLTMGILARLIEAHLTNQQPMAQLEPYFACEFLHAASLTTEIWQLTLIL